MITATPTDLNEIVARLFAQTTPAPENTKVLFSEFLTHFIERYLTNITNHMNHYGEELFLHTLFPEHEISAPTLHTICLQCTDTLISRYETTTNPQHHQPLLRLCQYLLTDDLDNQPIPDQFLDFILETYSTKLPYNLGLEWTNLTPSQVLRAWTHTNRDQYLARYGYINDWKHIAATTRTQPLFHEVCSIYLTSQGKDPARILPEDLTPNELNTFESTIPSATHPANLWFLFQPHSSAAQHLKALRTLGSKKKYPYKDYPIRIHVQKETWSKLNHKQRIQAYIHLAKAVIDGHYPAEALPPDDTFHTATVKLTLKHTPEHKELLQEFSLYQDWMRTQRTHTINPVDWWEKVKRRTIDTLELEDPCRFIEHLSEANTWFMQQDQPIQQIKGWYLNEMSVRIRYSYHHHSTTTDQIACITQVLSHRPPFLIYPKEPIAAQ